MCPKCGKIICICHDKPEIDDSRQLKKSKIQVDSPKVPSILPLVPILSDVAVTPFGGFNFNVLDTPTVGRNFRIMSWNIERLGDTGGLGKHGGERPQDIIEAIAKIIFKADPHICALIEVFTGAKGKEEVGRIFTALCKLCEKTATVWDYAFSPGEGTGGLSEPDGSKRRDREGYAILWRYDLGIECPKTRWLNIYGVKEIYTESGKGRSYVRDACEFTIEIKGKKLFGSHGMDLSFPIAVFHAPGPRADLQRQTLIKDAITDLFAKYASPEGNREECPNAFICADFNASEDADNLVTEESFKEIDYSFPGDLDYMARLISLVTKVELMRNWVKINDLGKVKEFGFHEFLKNFYKFDEFKLAAYKNTKPALVKLEKVVNEAELWFATYSKVLKLTGAREAEKEAKKNLLSIIENRIKLKMTNVQFETEKNRFKLWKTAINAKDEVKFSEAYWNLDEVEGEDFLLHLVDNETVIEDWEDVQKLVCAAFEEEFEDQQAFLGSRSITTYTNKIVSVTMRNVNSLVVNQKKLNIEESYETAFSSGVDTGFFESTSYNEKLKTTRRKSILLTGFAKGAKGGKWTAVKGSGPDSVLYSNYDQVLSRTDRKRIDEPVIVTVPILGCVLGEKWKPIFNSIYLGCAFTELKIPSIHKFFVKICASANAEYKEGLKKHKKPDYNLKNKVAFDVYKKYKANSPHCCLKQCATIVDINFLHEMQTYLSRSHAISDHEPVLMTAKFKPHLKFEGSYI